MFHLERACTMQVRTRMLGPWPIRSDPAVVDKTPACSPIPNRQELRSTTLVMARRCCARSTASTPATKN